MSNVTSPHRLPADTICSKDNKGFLGGLAKRLHLERYSLYLLFLLCAFIIFNLIKNHYLGLHVDEALWWIHTKHLQAGYFSHPPFIVFELFIITRTLGDSPLALRVGSLAFTTGSLLLIYFVYVDMFKNRRWAFLVTLLVSILPITIFWLTLAHQDSPFIFFSLLTLFLVWKAISRSESKYWYLAGLSAGLMLLCKLQAAIIFPSLFLFLLTSRQNRSWLKKKEPYLAFAIVVVMFIPTLIWYISHNFEPITYQITNRPGFLDQGFVGYISSVTTHIGKEILVLSPFVYLASLFGIACACWLGYFNRGDYDQRFQLLLWLSAPVILFFTITGGPPNWAIIGHFISLIAVAGALPILLRRAQRFSMQRTWLPLLVTLCLSFAFIFGLATLTIAGGDLLQNEYQGLAEKVEEVREEMSDETTYLAGPYFFIPAEVAYYLKDHEFQGYSMAFLVYEHEVVGVGGSSYKPWTPMEEIVGKDMLFIDSEMNPDGYDTPVSFWEEKLAPYFERVDPPVIFSYKKWGNDVRRYYIFKCYGFKGPDEYMDNKGEISRYINRHHTTQKNK